MNILKASLQRGWWILVGCFSDYTFLDVVGFCMRAIRFCGIFGTAFCAMRYDLGNILDRLRFNVYILLLLLFPSAFLYL